jgi:hypothetical protein
MRPRHRAACVLAGWVMILPPLLTSGQRGANAPLWEWRRVDQFDSESACRQALAKLIEQMPDSGMNTARCVPSDYLKNEQVPQKVGGGREYQEFDLLSAMPARSG